MSNTVIQIKRSQTTALPGSLTYGELAYSFNSGKLTIGQANGQVIVIGGNNYTQIIDSATSANTATTIVKRDASGNFSASTISAELDGNSATTTKWKTSRLIGVSGDATGQVSVDGTANANVPLTLVTVNTDIGTWGGATNIPVFTVNEKGLVTAAANVSISTGLNISGDSGTDTIDLLSETLDFAGGDGINSTVTANTVTFDVDATVLRTSGGQTIGGNLTVSGDLFVGGNTVTMNVSTLSVEDSLIRLANNNLYSDSIDIGFYGSANPGTGAKYYGLARSINDSGNFFLFKDLDTDPVGNTIPTASITTANTATLRANITGGTVSGLESAITVTDGGTGIRSVTSGDILYANGSNSLTTLAAASAGNVLISGTSPSWDKVGLTTHVSGVLPIANGGTNAASIGTAGSIAYSNGTSYLFNTAGSAGQALISGATGAPTFGTLDLRGGGLGITTANTNSVLFYSGAGDIISNTNTPSDGHVLQYSVESGVSFSMLDGGVF